MQELRNVAAIGMPVLSVCPSACSHGSYVMKFYASFSTHSEVHFHCEVDFTMKVLKNVKNHLFGGVVPKLDRDLLVY